MVTTELGCQLFSQHTNRMEPKNTMFFSDETLWEESRDTEPRLSLLRMFSLEIAGSDDDRALVRSLSAPFNCNHPLSLHELSCLKPRRSGSESSPLLTDDYRTTSRSLTSNSDLRRGKVEGRVRGIEQHRSNHRTLPSQNPDVLVMSSPSRNIAERDESTGCYRFCESDAVAVPLRNVPVEGRQPACSFQGAAVSNNSHLIDDTRSIWYAQTKEARGISILDTAISWRSSDLDRKRFERKFDHFSAADTLLSVGNPSTVAFPYGQSSESLLPVRPIAPVAGSILKPHSRPLIVPTGIHLANSSEGNNETYKKPFHKSETGLYISQKHGKQFFADMPSVPGRPGGPIVENGEALQYDNAYNRSNGGRFPVRTQTSSSSDVNRAATLRNGTSSIIDDGPNAAQNEGTLQPTPLFERLVTEEVQELRAYVRIVENQNRRLIELERVHGDLEIRLEVESKSRQQLEATLEAREREWAEKLEQVERDRDQWKLLVETEKIKNSKLIDQVVRKDQDIHRMLQRKYDTEITRSTRNARGGGSDQREKPKGTGGTSSSKSPDVRTDAAHKSPHQILAAAGSAEKVRNRNAKSLLVDFFGI